MEKGKKNMKKKILMIVTALVLAIAMMPTMVFAADGDITVNVTIKNDNFASTLLNDAGKKINPAWTGTLVDSYEVTIAENETAADAIETACDDNGIALIDKAGYYGRYASNIDGLKASAAGIATDAWGYGFWDSSGWSFLVNGVAGSGMDYYVNSETPGEGASRLNAGDSLTLAYSIDGVTTDKAFAQGVKLNKTKVTLAKGKNVKLEAAIEPANGAVAAEGAAWTTSDKTVAAVDKAGKVTGKAAGIATIKATAKNTLSAKCKVTIKPLKTKITSLKAGKKAAIVKWTKKTDATGDVIYRATKKAGKYKAVKTITKKGTTKWTNKKLKSGKKYFYKIKVYKTSKAGKVYSDFSNIKSVKVK